MCVTQLLCSLVDLVLSVAEVFSKLFLFLFDGVQRVLQLGDLLGRSLLKELGLFQAGPLHLTQANRVTGLLFSVGKLIRWSTNYVHSIA